MTDVDPKVVINLSNYKPTDRSLVVKAVEFYNTIKSAGESGSVVKRAIHDYGVPMNDLEKWNKTSMKTSRTVLLTLL